MDKKNRARGLSNKDRIRAYCAVIFCENENNPLYAEGIFERIKRDPDFKCKSLERKKMGHYLKGIDIIGAIGYGYEKMYRIRVDVYKKLYRIRDDVYKKLPRDLIIKSRKQTRFVQDLIDKTMKEIEDEAVKLEEES